MKSAEVREKTKTELQQMAAKLEEELFILKFKLGAGQLKQTSEIRKKRKDIARVKTFLNAQTKE